MNSIGLSFSCSLARGVSQCQLNQAATPPDSFKSASSESMATLPDTRHYLELPNTSCSCSPNVFACPWNQHHTSIQTTISAKKNTAKSGKQGDGVPACRMRHSRSTLLDRTLLRLGCTKAMLRRSCRDNRWSRVPSTIAMALAPRTYVQNA